MKKIYKCSLFINDKLLGVLDFETEKQRTEFLDLYFDFMRTEKISYMTGSIEVPDEPRFNLDDMPIE